MKKRISFAIITLCLFVSLLPVTAGATGNPFSMHYTWNGTEIANCTYVAWQQAYDRLGIELPMRGNAKGWLDEAQGKYATGTTPQADSIVVYGGGVYGHVAYVTNVSGDRITVIENGNWNGSYSSSLKTRESSGAAGTYYGDSSLIGYIYLRSSTSNNPIGYADEISGGNGYVYVRGWTFDPDEPDASLEIHVYIGGATHATGEGHGGMYADKTRDDVNEVYGITGKHGFEETIKTDRTGEQLVCIYGINKGGGGNVIFAERTVVINAPEKTVTFTPWENAAYTYIRETDAAIGQRISVSGGTCTETGMVLYDASGRELGKGINNYYDTQPACFWINAELDVTLTSGTSYKYKFYAVVDGKTFWSEESSFTTPRNVAVSSVSFDYEFAVMEVGGSLSLSATVLPENAANKALTWTSSNTDVVTVDSNGLVTSVGGGKATVTAFAGDKSASCSITVIKKLVNNPEVHFEKQTVYYQDQFTDVPANQWYTPSVASAFEFGLMKGNGDSTFNPYGDVTVAEAVTMAARIHSIYTTGTESFVQTGDKWYQVYLDYALENGIISKAYYNSDVTHKATRAQFAEIFADALPSEALSAMNSVADNAIPDVSISESFAASVYKLYRAGILTGSDANGTFNPTTYITRAEAAAIVSRMAESGNRVSITL